MKFAVVSKEGVFDYEATSKRFADIVKEFHDQVLPYTGLKTDENGVTRPENTFTISKEVRATIKEGLITVGAFQAPRGGEGGGRQSNVDFSRLQTVYSNARRDYNNLYQANKSTFYNVVANKFNADESDFEKWTNPQAVARYVKETKINDVATPSVTEPVV